MPGNPNPNPDPDPGPEPDPDRVTQTYEHAGLGIAIPDNNAAGASYNFTVDTSGFVLAAEFSLNVTHTYQGDLRATLTSPSGTSVILHNRQGGSANDLDLNLSSDDLSAFQGENPTGEWTVNVSDNARIDTGTIDALSLTLITAATEDPSPPPTEPEVTFAEYSFSNIALAIPDNNADGVQDCEPRGQT